MAASRSVGALPGHTERTGAGPRRLTSVQNTADGRSPVVFCHWLDVCVCVWGVDAARSLMLSRRCGAVSD